MINSIKDKLESVINKNPRRRTIIRVVVLAAYVAFMIILVMNIDLDSDFVKEPKQTIKTGIVTVLFAASMYAGLIWIFKRPLFADLQYLLIMGGLALIGFLIIGIGIYYLP